ncbi:MAG: hypothetical protein ACRDJP_11060, partial [Actinomycetota bacterium]
MVQFESNALGIIILVLFVGALVGVMVIAANLYSFRRMIRRYLFPDGVPAIPRECPHCFREMHAQAVVCAFCGRESEPWRFHDGRWWRVGPSGKQQYLDVNRWV